MVINILALLMGVLALFLTFRVRWVLSVIFKIENPSDKTILNVKYIALAIAVAAFVITFLSDKI